jgi:riboflavin synthase
LVLFSLGIKMFTGIIHTVGKITAIKTTGADKTVTVYAPQITKEKLELGESIAVNGVCLTVVAFDANSFSADVSIETLNYTSLKDIKTNSQVNCERALTLESRLGGHMVSGHVDGTGRLLKKFKRGSSYVFEFSYPVALAKYISCKGSICIDGTSLTVNNILNNRFSVNIIPHTIKNTIIKNYYISTLVNLEIDIIARYLEKLLEAKK